MGKTILIGAIIGSIIGWLVNYPILPALILGSALSGIIYFLFKRKNESFQQGHKPKQTIQLKEEQLDIKKERVQTGEVKIHKEVVEDKKTVTVPIRREEMVIEAGDEEQYRIPLKEEEIDITKHLVQLAEISVSKRQVEEIQQVKETVKKEVLDVGVNDEVDVSKK